MTALKLSITLPVGEETLPVNVDDFKDWTVDPTENLVGKSLEVMLDQKRMPYPWTVISLDQDAKITMVRDGGNTPISEMIGLG